MLKPQTIYDLNVLAIDYDQIEDTIENRNNYYKQLFDTIVAELKEQLLDYKDEFGKDKLYVDCLSSSGTRFLLNFGFFMEKYAERLGKDIKKVEDNLQDMSVSNLLKYVSNDVKKVFNTKKYTKVQYKR